MHSKSNALNSSIGISVYIHLGLILFFVGVSLLSKIQIKKTIEFDVIEAPRVSTSPVVTQPQAPPKQMEPPKQHAVFGASKNTLMDEKNGTETVKRGNTIAKEVDEEQLDDDDPDRIPIPADEYLVTQMPVLVNEFRVPYPKDAKDRRVEGDVILDAIIDKNGKVRKIDLIRGPGYGLDEAAQNALLKFVFKPAMIAQKPVAVKIRYTYRFKLEN